MRGRLVKVSVALLALCGAVAAKAAPTGDADRERLITTPPEISTRGETAPHVCFGFGGFESEAGGFIDLGPRPCTRQYDPLHAAGGDTLTVRTPRSARSVGLSVDGAEREGQECRLLERGRWLCAMPGDGDGSLRLGIEYPLGVASWTFDTKLSPPRGRMPVRISRRAVATRRAYREGAVQLVKLRRSGAKGPFLVRRLGDRSFKALLPAGRFLLSSTTRVCSGSCPTRTGGGSLDAPRHTCRSRIDVKRGDRLTATVVTRVGERCRIRRR